MGQQDRLSLRRNAVAACSARAVVLVWSHGCMDRFLDDKDAGHQDFVRLEYSQVRGEAVAAERSVGAGALTTPPCRR